MHVDPLLREALALVIRLHSGEATTDDAELIAQWRRQGPEHEQAFREAIQLWRTLGEAARNLVAENQSQAVTTFLPRMRSFVANRRFFIGGAVAASAAAAGYFAFHPMFDLWPSVEALSADYHTAKGERRDVVLAGDVSVKLNTETSLNIKTISNVPRIQLISGEAAIRSQITGLNPLTVVTRVGMISAFEAEFNARCLDRSAAVSCVRGSVALAFGEKKMRLSEGQQVTYSPDKGLAAPKEVDLAQATAWERGLLIVHNWSLDRLVAEVNRYRPGKIIVTNTGLGSRMVSGTFYLDHLDDFVGQARGLFGANVRSLPGGIVFLS